jgi:hypothetical protein
MALLAEENQDVPSNRAEHLTRLEWINNKHDKGPAQIESLGSNSTNTENMIMKRRREEDDEVELKVDVRQPSTFGRIVDGYASHSNQCLLSFFPPPPNPDCSASERQKSLESAHVSG